uniref:Uncharacterized protein n=1 Tax=Arundo donax TaxID=35708 RepID=A0A0A8XV78_ARUDO
MLLSHRPDADLLDISCPTIWVGNWDLRLI